MNNIKPLVICWDFNSEPSSGSVTIIKGKQLIYDEELGIGPIEADCTYSREKVGDIITERTTLEIPLR